MPDVRNETRRLVVLEGVSVAAGIALLGPLVWVLTNTSDIGFADLGRAVLIGALPFVGTISLERRRRAVLAAAMRAPPGTV